MRHQRPPPRRGRDLTLADVGVAMEAAGITSAITVNSARSVANRGKGRGTRATTKTYLGRVCLRGHDDGTGHSARRRDTGNCIECRRLDNLARHAESNRRRLAAEKVVGSEAYWKHRENNWRKQGILRVDGEPLDRETYAAVMRFQQMRCSICNVEFAFSGQLACAEHNHRSGLFRGVACGGKRGCNAYWIYRVETGRGIKRRDPRTDEDVAAIRARVEEYLADPPYSRWLRSRAPP